MAKNTNPITKKIYGQNSWSTITFHTGPKYRIADLYHDFFVRKLIHGVCLKLNLLTSQIQILKHATGIVEINFMFMPIPYTAANYSANRNIGVVKSSNDHTGLSSGLSDDNLNNKIIELKLCVRSILELKFNRTYKFKILQAPNLFNNTKILTDYIEIKLSENPRVHRPLLMKLFNEFKKTAGFSRKQSKLSLINLIGTYLATSNNPSVHEGQKLL